MSLYLKSECRKNYASIYQNDKKTDYESRYWTINPKLTFLPISWCNIAITNILDQNIYAYQSYNATMGIYQSYKICPYNIMASFYFSF